jgi:glucosylceramidase
LDYVHDTHPDKQLIFTEISLRQSGRKLPWQLLFDMRGIVLETINRGCASFLSWNYLLDMDGKPYQEGGACPECIGMIDIERDYHTIHHNSHYYCASHLSTICKFGGVRVKVSSSNDEGIAYTAFQNKDGRVGFVVLNETIPTWTVMSYAWKGDA